MAADPKLVASEDNDEEPEEKIKPKPEPKEKAKEIAPEPQIKLVVYDFDQTITCIHLYHVLSGMHGDQEDALKKMSDRDLTHIFGGNERVERLNVHFNRLSAAGSVVAIVSYGYVAVIRKALNRMKLNQFADSVVIGGDSEELGEVNDDKGECIKAQFYNTFSPQTILFVDDDRYNTDAAKQRKICETLLIDPRSGMNNNHMRYIEEQCGAFK